MHDILRIDPVTRIEGHLGIEVKVKNGKVVDAWSSGTLFRGIETILIGRDPADAPVFTQRSCGVCTYSHLICSLRAVENAIGVTIPPNARILRNLLHGAQLVADHIVHFYHLHALDWVDVISAISANVKKTAELADSVSNWERGGVKFYTQVQQRLKTFVDSGQLGIFNNAYWGHPAYKLPPEANLMAAAHYIEALRVQTRAAKMLSIFGGKAPHPDAPVVGGLTCIRDLTPDRIAEFKYMWQYTQEFIENVYMPDLLAVAGFYKDWGAIGGTTNFLTWGDFPQTDKEPESFFMPRGVIMDRDLKNIKTSDPSKVLEHIKHSWYKKGKPKHPAVEETLPEAGEYDRDKKYSWIKAPRYDGKPCEVGPLARVLVAYAKGHKEIKEAVDNTLKTLDVPVEALFSTLGRTAARAIETVVIGRQMDGWINELLTNIKNGDDKIYQSWTMPEGTVRGAGLNDVARGALGHWIEIEKGKIKNYQYVVPSTWNLGPRCDKGKLGPVEQSLIGTPVQDVEKPIEVLRTVHSFDPCLSCAVHVVDYDTNKSCKARIC
ncbi:MAG: nickel-dependent hydrogenase large subunit [Deltaproteobacteria bacterium]|nr:nickel-dependent hydrogenase large subunit [Deltaproteobacteria bacterium]